MSTYYSNSHSYSPSNYDYAFHHPAPGRVSKRMKYYNSYRDEQNQYHSSNYEHSCPNYNHYSHFYQSPRGNESYRENMERHANHGSEHRKEQMNPHYSYSSYYGSSYPFYSSGYSKHNHESVPQWESFPETTYNPQQDAVHQTQTLHSCSSRGSSQHSYSSAFDIYGNHQDRRGKKLNSIAQSSQSIRHKAYAREGRGDSSSSSLKQAFNNEIETKRSAFKGEDNRRSANSSKGKKIEESSKHRQSEDKAKIIRQAHRGEKREGLDDSRLESQAHQNSTFSAGYPQACNRLKDSGSNDSQVCRENNPQRRRSSIDKETCTSIFAQMHAGSHDKQNLSPHGSDSSPKPSCENEKDFACNQSRAQCKRKLSECCSSEGWASKAVQDITKFNDEYVETKLLGKVIYYNSYVILKKEKYQHKFLLHHMHDLESAVDLIDHTYEELLKLSDVLFLEDNELKTLVSLESVENSHHSQKSDAVVPLSFMKCDGHDFNNLSILEQNKVLKEHIRKMELKVQSMDRSESRYHPSLMKTFQELKAYKTKFRSRLSSLSECMSKHSNLSYKEHREREAQIQNLQEKSLLTRKTTSEYIANLMNMQCTCKKQKQFLKSLEAKLLVSQSCGNEFDDNVSNDSQCERIRKLEQKMKVLDSKYDEYCLGQQPHASECSPGDEQVHRDVGLESKPEFVTSLSSSISDSIERNVKVSVAEAEPKNQYSEVDRDSDSDMFNKAQKIDLKTDAKLTGASVHELQGINSGSNDIGSDESVCDFSI